MKTIRDLGEFGLIQHLHRRLRPPGRTVQTGIGDDCAVLRSHDPKTFLLYTCDPVVEGIHYLPGSSPRQVGWKVMARNLSDIAAMSGQPRWAVVSLGLRPNTPVNHVTALYDGLQAAAAKFGCHIVGGDTTHVRHEQFVVVTLLGEVERHRLTLRSGAKPGDHVFVTGKLGNSFAGKHLTFTPRLRESRWLTAHFRIHAMLDLSDGLASDLNRLVESSHVGFDVVSTQIPANTTVRAALTDGEDYELLFTVSPRTAAKLKAAWKFRLPLTEIGRVVRRRTVLLDGQPLTAAGYDHFRPRRGV